MNVLFDTRHSDTASSAIEHGKRVASALLDRWFGTRFFASLGRDHSTAFYQVPPTHVRAKSCPMRPMAHQKHKKFTTTQRDAWVGHVIRAAQQWQTSEAFQRALGYWLAKNIDVYAPFVNDLDQTKDIKLMMQEEDAQKDGEFVYLPSISCGIFGSWLYSSSSPKI